MSNSTRIDQLERNLIINGNMDFWQRGTTSGAITGTVKYTADRFLTYSNAETVTVTQSTSVPTLAQSGYNSRYSMLITNSTGVAQGAGNYVIPGYRVEGQDYQQIHGKKARLQFWCNISVIGTYSISFQNAAANRSYVTTFSVPTANTWQLVTIDLSLDTAGTWNFDNTAGLNIYIALAAGTTYQTGTLNTWQAGNFNGSTTQTDWGNVTGATAYFTQFMLIPQDFTQAGAATVSVPFQRCGRSIGHELQMCQRYCFDPFFSTPNASAGLVGTGVCISTTVARIFIPYPVLMRTNSPGITVSNQADFAVVWGSSAAATTTVASYTYTNSGGALDFGIGTASFTAGNGAFARGNATSPQIIFDTEL